jgi:hypothetical protein
MSAAKAAEKGNVSGVKLVALSSGKARLRAVGNAAHAKTSRTVARSSSSRPSRGPTKPVESKAEFVRGLPSNAPAKEVVAQAEAAGLSVTESYVYSVRSADRRAKRTLAAKKNASKPAAATALIVHEAASAPKIRAGAEAVLVAAAAEIGLGKALEVLQSERARVRGLIGG